MSSNRGNKFSARWSDIFEVGILFFIFCIFGGSPIPDVNEPYYIGKAIHFWNASWAIDDTFLSSRDSHWTFYFLFGWTSFFLSPYWMAVLGRGLTWFLLALSWRRLCFTILRTRWSSIPTGLAMSYYVLNFNMAGEWIIGGVEGKSFAFPLVLFALSELVRGEWGRVWIFLGAASAFHVLVGGWSVIAVIIVHLFCWRKPNYYFMLAGGLISLSGVIPGLLLDYGTVGDIVHESHRIYVFERLNHHLVPYMFSWTRIVRFLLLMTLWIFCCRFMPYCGGRQRRFEFFVWGTIIISAIGFFLAYILRSDASMSASVLRFYWFRMSDVSVPMGIAIGSMFRLLRLLVELRKSPICLPTFRDWIIAALISVTIFMSSGYLLFGVFMFSWTRSPDVAITWCITILLCRLILYVVNSAGRDCGILSCCRLKIWLILIYVVILIYTPMREFTELADSRTRFAFSRAESKKPIQAYKWREACNWISDEKNTSKSSKFFIPYDSVTFKWYANRSNITVWKEVPQDANSLIEWAKSIEELYVNDSVSGKDPRRESGGDSGGESGGRLELLIDKISKKTFSQMLNQKTPDEMKRLQKKYRFNYILAPISPNLSKRFGFKIVYKNSEYCVYKVEDF
ncbi:MAG: hypothetical protein LBB88_02335 [Planctomycetaceae bacterium]|jgi:hypothetical protein|nr:hypothetical protein [Planctomycetaceae bacterium]